MFSAFDIDDLKYYFDNREGFMRKRSNFHAAIAGFPEFDYANFLNEDNKTIADHMNDDVYEFMV